MRQWLPAILSAVAVPLSAATSPPAGGARTRPDYAIAVQAATRTRPEWAEVVDVLLAHHHAVAIEYQREVGEALPELRRCHPRYTCFVTDPADVTREFVAAVHQLCRQYDDDPYADTLWGILTGYDAANALAIARHGEPLTVRKVAGGTEFALSMCQEGLWYDELVKNKLVRKQPGGEIQTLKGPDDTTQALADTLNRYHADLFITSGHATERDWQLGFRYRNGSFRSRAGQMFGIDTKGRRIDIDSPNPKVYLPVGNCLMGHINGPDAMALAWMNDVGVRQMIGYTKPTWYGYAGWGCLDYFVEQPGRFTFAEAFFANQHALVHRLQTVTSAQDRRGLTFDRDVVAFYGDPAWEARMADAPNAWEQSLTHTDGVWTFTVTPKRGADTFKPINTNGSQRGWRPIIQFFPCRLGEAEVLSGADLQPVIADDFLLVPNPRTYDPTRDCVVRFRAVPQLRSR